MSKRIVFFGNERLATGVTTTTPVVHSLLEAGYDIAAIVTNHHDSGGRSNRQLEIANFADEHEIPLLFPEDLSEISGQLSKLEAEIGVLVAYGKMVPQSVIELFPKGIVNLHPSLLPKHRGPTPLESVILDGSELTGVSIMRLAREMDAGPIYAQSEYRLDGSKTKQRLADDLLEIGSAMMLDVLPGILNGTVVAAPQDESAATYDQLITKSDGRLDLNKPAKELERAVRAYAGWPGSRLNLNGIEVIVGQARLIDNPDGSTPGQARIIENELIICTPEAALSLDRLKPIGKNEMSAGEFIRGYGRKLQI